MTVVGLTGGVATGKSLVSAELGRLGARIIDADLISREVFRPGTHEFEEAVRAFGAGILASDGTIDRKRLGAVVFGDPVKLRLLNGITHPAILRRIREDVESLKGAGGEDVIVVDAALLFETGLDVDMDTVVVVYAPPDAQVARLMKRDGLTLEEARSRIDSQMPIDEKVKRAGHIIDNSADAANAVAAARALFDKIKSGAYRKKRG